MVVVAPPTESEIDHAYTLNELHKARATAWWERHEWERAVKLAEEQGSRIPMPEAVERADQEHMRVWKRYVLLSMENGWNL